MSSESEIRQFLEATEEHLTEALLEYASIMPMSLINIGKLALSAPGKVLSAVPRMQQAGGTLPSPLPRWPLYVIEAYRAGASYPEDTWRDALPGAVAVEIAMSAADLLDELTDDDPSPVAEQYGPGQALNTANLMLVMAQQVLLKAAQSSTKDLYLAALAALQEMLVEAAVGQHLDMLYDGLPPGVVTLEMSADVTAKKAGALIAGAWRVGAVLSGAEAPVVDLLTRLGRETGGFAQLSNDLEAVLPLDISSSDVSLMDEGGTPGLKTDLRLRKRTMPIVFTLREEGEAPNPLQRAFSDPTYAASVDEDTLRRAIVEAGGVQFVQLVMEVHAQTIVQLLAELETLRPGATEALGYLLPVQAAEVED
ncbi:MAG: geranylgeranyl diphosphate synthase, type [Chloroflexia bacterium]|nr:geranylgeranyl diphosphate synthase, type [Chloroflexia bacterium]